MLGIKIGKENKQNEYGLKNISIQVSQLTNTYHADVHIRHSLALIYRLFLLQMLV